jgi:hypothetical protein
VYASLTSGSIINHKNRIGSHVLECRYESCHKAIVLVFQEHYPGQFQTRALELIAKRISAATGDMRTALAVCNAARTAAARRVSQPSAASAAVITQSQPLGVNQDNSLDSTARCDANRAQVPCCESGNFATNTELISVNQAAEALRVCCSGGSAQAQVCNHFHIGYCIQPFASSEIDHVAESHLRVI